MNENKDTINKKGFINKIKTSEHKGFEISMFVISVVLAMAVVITVVWIGVYLQKANATKITDEEADAGSVTESAVVADKDEEPLSTPDGNIIERDDDFEDDIDEELKDAEYAYTTAVVNLRSTASLTASVITKVPMGVRVKLVRMTKDNWMEVKYEGQTGYIHARYLSVTKIAPLATVEPTVQPKATAAPTATPVVKTTSKPKKTKKPKVTKAPTEPEEPDETEEPAEETAAPTAAPTKEPSPEPTVKPTKEPTEVPVETKTPDASNE